MSLILSGTSGLSDVDGSAATPAIRGTDANTGMFFPAADTIAFSEGGVESVRIDASGNVGVGTVSPIVKLNVTGAAVTNADARSLIFATDTSAFAAGVGGGISFLAKYNTAGTYFEAGNVKGIKENGTDGNFAGALAFTTHADGGSPTERMRINSSGNVGIGTASPASTAKLTVQGGGANGTGGTRLLSDTLYANGANYEAYGRRQDANGSGGFAPGVLLARVNTAPAAITSTMNLGRVAFGGSYDGTDANVVYGAQIAGYSSGTYSASSAATDIVFFTTPSGTAGGTTSGTANFGSERMRLDSSGNLMVGTASVGYTSKLAVNGGIETYATQFNIVSNSGATFEWVLRTGSTQSFYVNNASVVATLSTTGVWTNASDARYKENIVESGYGLSTVMALKPRAYNLIGQADKPQIGFIAQEVLDVLPEVVDSTYNSITEEDRYTLSYGQISAVLVKAIQELKAEVDSLKAQLQGAA